MNYLFSYYFESSWNSSRYKFFAWYVICQYFLLFCGLSYYSLNSVLRRSKLLILMTYYLSFFSFIDYNFSVIARDILPKSNHKTISCMFSSKVFTVLFTFYIYIYNSFFCIMWHVGQESFYWIGMSIFYTFILWKDSTCAIELLCTFVKIKLTVFVWIYFWIF